MRGFISSQVMKPGLNIQTYFKHLSNELYSKLLLFLFSGVLDTKAYASYSDTSLTPNSYCTTHIFQGEPAGMFVHKFLTYYSQALAFSDQDKMILLLLYITLCLWW